MRNHTSTSTRRATTHADTQRNGNHSLATDDLRDLGGMATKLMRDAVDEVNERVREGGQAIMEKGMEAREEVEKKIGTYPLASVGIAFAAGALGALVWSAYRHSKKAQA